MTQHFEYFSDWRTTPMACPKCGWAGPAGALDTELFDALMDLRCPVVECDARIAVVSYPLNDEVDEAARTGNAEAVRMLASRRAYEAAQTAEEKRPRVGAAQNKRSAATSNGPASPKKKSRTKTGSSSKGKR